MTKTPAPAKTPGVAIARVLRGLGLKQGTDFGVRAERKNGERIGTYVAVFGQQANQKVADNANLIEQQAGDGGFHFNVSVYFTPSGTVWVRVANYGEKTRQTHFLSASGRTENTATVDTAEDAEAKTLRDRAVALADQRTEAAAGAQAASDCIDMAGLANVQQGTEQLSGRWSFTAPQPTIRATLAAPRPAFEQQPEAPKPVDPYAGRTKRHMGGRVWGCGEAGQMWYFQTTEHGPRYTLRVYLGTAYANGWYLTGPGLGRDTYMAGSLGEAAARAHIVIAGFQLLTDAMEKVILDFPKGQRVQGVDNYNVTCGGTVNGVAWGAVTQDGHPNFGRTWVDVTWDEMPHNRGTDRRSRPFSSDLIKH